MPIHPSRLPIHYRGLVLIKSPIAPSKPRPYTYVSNVALLHSAAPRWQLIASIPTLESYHTAQDVEAKVAACERITTYTATHKSHIITALNASACKIEYNNANFVVPSNSALAVLGDARMNGVLCKWWWGTHTPDKHRWTTLRHDKCANGPLAALGRRVGLHKCSIQNPGQPFMSDKLVATMVEAVMGAVYLDGGEEELERVMMALKFDEHEYL